MGATGASTGSPISDAARINGEGVMRAAWTPPPWDQPVPRHAKHNPFTKSIAGARLLSASMLPFFIVCRPQGFGVLTTTGRRTGKTRRKCVRVIRRGDKAYLVMLTPVLHPQSGANAVAGWLWNIRTNPRVQLRTRGATTPGVARELEDPIEIEQAKHAYCAAVHTFDYVEFVFHTACPPTRAKIQRMHRHWFDTGIPLAVDLQIREHGS